MGKRRKTRKAADLVKKKMPAKFFRDDGVSVCLGDELASNVRSIQTSSNPMGDAFQHIYRRGLLPSKRRKHNRVGRTALSLPRTRKLKEQVVNPITPEQMLGKDW